MAACNDKHLLILVFLSFLLSALLFLFSHSCTAVLPFTPFLNCSPLLRFFSRLYFFPQTLPLLTVIFFPSSPFRRHVSASFHFSPSSQVPLARFSPHCYFLFFFHSRLPSVAPLPSCLLPHRCFLIHLTSPSSFVHLGTTIP